MIKKLSVGVAALAVVAFAGSAMAAGPVPGTGQYQVDVNIDVQPVVSMWANDDSVQLVMDGADGNNSATSESSLSVINNVAANVTASVTGDLPDPSVPGGGINFFIFQGVDAAGAVDAITNDAYNAPVAAPATSSAWNKATLGTTKTIIADTGVNASIENFPITYASSAPGELVAVDNHSLVVTYTITAN